MMNKTSDNMLRICLIELENNDLRLHFKNNLSMILFVYK